jgi:adenylate cyclase
MSPSHRLLALWFADIAGYSTRASQDERGALEVVEILQALARETVRRHDGRIVKFLGDAVLAEFPSTESAVRAASILSEQFPVRSAVTGRPHDLRVGVHLGDVVVGVDGDLYGDGVNAAARVQEVAEPGQVLVSDDVWRQLRSRGEFRFESLGDRALKGVGPVGLHVVSVQRDTEPGTLPTETAIPGGQEPRRLRSIAVLPFADLSPEHDQEYFGDGMAEEILNGLTKVPGLQVPARTSCFVFRETNVDVRDIGTRLGVEAVLEGSVRKAGNRLRIAAQLIDVRNGYHLWSERYDRQMEDIFSVQDEIARSILDAIGFSHAEPDLLKSSTSNVAAYDFYLRGRKFFQKWTRQNVEFAQRMFERAIKIDPGFAGAWAGLATAHVHLYRWGREPRDLEEAHTASVRALELDPDLAEAHVAAGQGLSIERKYQEAESEFERAIELDPTLFDAYYYYARSSFEAGNPERAIRLYEEACRVRPDDYQPPFLMALPLKQLGRRDEARRAEEHAIELVEKNLELNPDDARAYSLGAGALAGLGEVERSRRWAEQATRLAPDDPVILYNNACTLAVLGEEEGALDALERALDVRVSHWDWITRDPDWERLRDHPRFQALVKRIQPS